MNLHDVIKTIINEMIKLNGKKPTLDELRNFMIENGIITKAQGIFEFRYLEEK